MGKFFDERNGGDIEGVAGVGFESANAALAENYVVVAASKDVFGAHQKFVHGGGHAALEKNRFADFDKRAKEIVILHVARADLEDVDITHHHLDLRSVHHFADGEEAEFVGGFAHDLEARFTQALKGVRRSARLEGAAAQDLRAGLGDACGNGMDLLAGFDRTGAGGDDHFRAADANTPAEIDDGTFGLKLAAGKFERLSNTHDLAHPVEQFEVEVIEVAVNADGAEDGVRFAGGAVNVEAAGDEAVDDMLDLGVGGPFLHHDDHKSFLFPSLSDSKRKTRDKRPATANTLPKRAAHSCPPLALPSPECMASRSAARASSMMRSKRRRMAASVSGPGLLRSAFSKTSFSRSG